MYPAYPYSYPHHTTPMPYAPQDDPRAKEITPHMKMDPSTMISPYQQPWSYGANYPYPVPHEYHGCCNHGYYGGVPYSYRPPYPHYPPPPPSLYSHGFYPPFPGAYPGYHIPPPHYSVEQPRYDYDKNNHDGQRCSRCTRVEDEKKPRVAQEEPEVDKKTNDSLVPLLLKDCPYPIMWVPPGYMKTEPEATEKENNKLDPVLPKHLEPVKQGGKGEIAQNQKDGDDYNRFPYKIFWLPSKNKEMENDAKENNVTSVADRGLLDEKKPLRMKDNDGSGSETESDMSGKHAVQKVIPVKQLHTNEGQKSPKVVQTKAKSGSVKNTDIDIEGKASPKASKLPPVCLRIDPLPGKKKSSRSPSPPADKQRSKGSTLDHPKTSQQQMELSGGLKKGKDEQSKNNIKNIQVTDDVKKVEKDTPADPCVDAAKREGNQSGKRMVWRVEKKFSEHEAALIIQSAYRGFEVRKSQPLTKLRQINGVRKQVADMRNRIQDLESSSTIRIDDKQKLIIGETIMSLLLKLDTIQGLHPVVRDARKSVAKELVGLQEKLDSLTLVKSETPSVETTSATEKVMRLEEDAIQDESDQGRGQSDSNVKLVDSDLGICGNQEVKATESEDAGAELRDTTIEQLLGLSNEKSKEESINNQLHVSAETRQPVDSAPADKVDQPHAQSDCNTGTVESDTCGVKSREAEYTNAVHENHDVEPVQVSEKDTTKLNINQREMSAVESELPLDDAIQEKHKVDESVPNIDFGKSDEACATVGDINLGVQVESESQQDTVELTSNQLEMETESPVDNDIQGKSDRAESGTNVVIVESDDVELAPQVESESQDIPLEPTNNQIEIAKEQPTEEEMFDEKQAMYQKQAMSEINVENVESCEHPKVESIEFQDDVNVKTCDVLPPKTVVDIDLPIEDATNEVQEDFIVSTEEAPKADDADSSAELVIEDLGGVSPLSPTGSRGDDKKLMEENEKLQVAVEELMKAGNQQLDIIKELTGRVKDLEKKLSKKKKVKPNKGRCRGSVVKDELRSCLV